MCTLLFIMRITKMSFLYIYTHTYTHICISILTHIYTYTNTLLTTSTIHRDTPRDDNNTNRIILNEE